MKTRKRRRSWKQWLEDVIWRCQQRGWFVPDSGSAIWGGWGGMAPHKPPSQREAYIRRTCAGANDATVMYDASGPYLDFCYTPPP